MQLIRDLLDPKVNLTTKLRARINAANREARDFIKSGDPVPDFELFPQEFLSGDARKIVRAAKAFRRLQRRIAPRAARRRRRRRRLLRAPRFNKNKNIRIRAKRKRKRNIPKWKLTIIT